MEEICDGLSDIYSIEVLPPGHARTQAPTTQHSNARNAHGTPTRAHTIALTLATKHIRTRTRTHMRPPTPAHAHAHARTCMRLQSQRDHFHGAQVFV